MKSFFGFGFPFFLKTIIPGTIGALIVWPILSAVGIKLGINQKSLDNSFLSPEIIFLGSVLLIGFMVNFLDDYIYRLYEGYILWPKALRKRLTLRLNRKIGKKESRRDKTNDETEKQLIWEWLMQFPLKKKRAKTSTEALLPTRLGNIISAYEDYPLSRYGISPMFFWDRLWLAIDKETRNEVNRVWSEADCITYISFIFLTSSIIYLVGFLVHLFNIPTLIFGPFGFPVESIYIGDISLTPWFFFGGGAFLLVLSYITYLLSLPLHVRNGNMFQSLFDLYQDKIETITKKREDKTQLWEESWCYLKYGLNHCNECSEYFPISMEECPHCKDLSENSSKKKG